jgi:hypothetical protein
MQKNIVLLNPNNESTLDIYIALQLAEGYSGGLYRQMTDNGSKASSKRCFFMLLNAAMLSALTYPAAESTISSPQFWG